ncbi:4888_t:CDS:2 [Rhizophagus irregularis]|nr:4888_t:CDS:2 [Rhizophagus irregularis]
MTANEIPLINVPYPPELTVEEILSRRSEDKLRSKAPNQFLIYRLAYIKELRKMIGENISMTKISRQISSSWAREPPEIKQAYKNLSGLAENRLKEIRQNNSLSPILIFAPVPIGSDMELARIPYIDGRRHGTG